MSEGPDRKARRTGWLLLAVAALVVIPAAAHVPLLVRYRREHAIAKHFEAMGGRCWWEPGSPPWPLSLLGKRYAKLYERLSACDLRDTKVTDAGLVHLKGLAGLQTLNLYDTQITDAGLVHLKGLLGLQHLWLFDTQITDAGLLHLKGLAALETLNLSSTQVTDAGLVNLKGLSGLEQLFLYNTQVIDGGVTDLKAALPRLNVLH